MYYDGQEEYRNKKKNKKKQKHTKFKLFELLTQAEIIFTIKPSDYTYKS